MSVSLGSEEHGLTANRALLPSPHGLEMVQKHLASLHSTFITYDSQSQLETNFPQVQGVVTVFSPECSSSM